MANARRVVLVSLIAISYLIFGQCEKLHNKYSKELNENSSWKNPEERERPFRMYKINLLWEKAQLRLAPEKLKALYSDLKLQDKDEMTLKRLRAEGGDKEGLKEAEIRKHFQALMVKYDMSEHLEHVENTIKHKRSESQHRAFNEASDEKIQKGLFKDKKLNKLWEKAERAGFSESELVTLKEELTHHQEKLDEYHNLMDSVNKEFEKNDYFENSLDRFQSEEVRVKSKNFKETSQKLKEKHEDLKQSYDKISRLSVGDAFEEVKVQELWKLAKAAKFSEEELQSLKEELQHYEHRIKKLKHLQAQADFHGIDGDKWLADKAKPDDQKHIEQRIKQYSHKIEKVHGDLHTRILQKHLEL